MAELSGASIDAARKREEALVAHNKAAAGTDVELEKVLHSAHQAQTQLQGRLDAIERALDEGVARAGNLKSPAAKRAFQQFLLDKHKQIVQVLQDAKQSSSDLASQMTGVGGQYQPVSDDEGDDDWFHAPYYVTPPFDPNARAGAPGAHTRIPDAIVKPAGLAEDPDDWFHSPVWMPPVHDPAGDKAGSDSTGPRIPDSVIKPTSFETPIKADGGVDNVVDPSHHDGQFAPPPPAAPVSDMPPRATGSQQPPPGASGGSQGIGMSSLNVDPTRHDPAPPAPITTAQGSQQVSGGDPHGSMGMGPGSADTTHPQAPAGAGPIYKDPRELGPAGMVEQIPHSGVWVRPDQVDHNVFTVSPHAMAPPNAVYVGKAPNGDEIWRYADPGPR